MATVTGLTYEQARAKQSELKSQSGFDPNKSKEYGKLENYIKTLKPENYGSETVASAQKALSTSTQAPSGGMAGIGATGGTSGINLSGLYDQYFNTDEIKSKKAELDSATASRDSAITSTQNNPWYSQASRGGKIAGIRSDSERNLTRINDELTRMQTDGQIQYNIKTQQYNIDRQEYQDSLALFNNLVSSGALVNASTNDIANLSVKTGIPTSMINSIVKTSQTKNLSLQTYSDGSNQYVVAIDPTSGAIVNKTLLGSTGSGSGLGNALKYLGLGNMGGQDTSGSNNQSLQSPPMSGSPGTQMEYPQGSGIIWVAGADGSWN